MANDNTLGRRRTGKVGDEYPLLQESHTIKDGLIQLVEIPDDFNPPIIDGYSMIKSGEPTSTQFKPDFVDGYVYFNQTENDKVVSVEYYGTGIKAFSAERIWLEESNGNITQTLGDYVTTLKDQNTEYIQSESSRVTAEEQRVSQENSRVTAEQGRSDAESQRESNENVREQNESARNTNETTREQNESDRQTNENTRIQQESDRQQAIDNLDFLNDYNPSTTYQPRNIVRYQSAVYMCKVESTNVPPTNTTNWRRLVSDGLNLHYLGEYDAATTYYTDDIVSLNGDSFICLTTSAGVLPTDTNNWRSFNHSSTKIVVLRNSVTLAQDSTSVNIGIGEYNSTYDELFVYKNSVLFTDYTIAGTTISSINGETWTVDPPTVFDFVVLKNVISDIPYGDGTLLQPGTVTNDKLANDIKVGSILNLKTNNKASMTDAINEIAKSQNEYEWTATEGQTLFTLPVGSEYTPESKTLQVWVSNVPQSNVVETSSTSFTLTEGVKAGRIVRARWSEGAVAAVLGHNLKHELGGTDEIDVTKLKNYKEQISDQIGDLLGLETTVKNSLVGAINEHDDQIGNLSRSASVPPTTGTWQLGERVWNSNPQAGGIMGWVCVTAGTFGSSPVPVFKEFGIISA